MVTAAVDPITMKLDQLFKATDINTDGYVEWSDYELVVIRSTWDYHHRFAAFHAWIDRLEAGGARLWNPPAILRWNTSKGSLARMTHPVLRPPPTVMLERGSTIRSTRMPEVARSAKYPTAILLNAGSFVNSAPSRT